jgi:hypothetical protein
MLLRSILSTYTNQLEAPSQISYQYITLITNTTNKLSMANVYPNQESTTSSQSHNQYCLNSKRETYTLWMKSLVLHSNGCTFYDSNGKIVYRVANYDRSEFDFCNYKSTHPF